MSFASQLPSTLAHSHTDDKADDPNRQERPGADMTRGDVPGPVDKPSCESDHLDAYGSMSTTVEETVDGGTDVQSDIAPPTVATITFLGKRSANQAEICDEVTAEAYPRLSIGATVPSICSIPGCGRTCPQLQFGPVPRSTNGDVVLCSVHKRNPTVRVARQCQVEGCQRVRSIGQYCTRHGRDPTAPIQNTPKGEHCKIPGCTRVVKRHGVCYRHYNLKDSDPTTLQTMELSVARPMQAYVDDPQLWDTLFQRLHSFVETNGHFQIPLGRSDLFDLSQFVDNMRVAYAVLKNGNQNGQRSIEFSPVSFVDNSIAGLNEHPGADADATTERAGERVDGKKAISGTTIALPVLQWSVLTPDRISKLNSIGFPWQWSARHGGISQITQSSTCGGGGYGGQHDIAPGNGVAVASWEARYQDLLKFYQNHGHYKVSRHSDFALWSWCKSRRQKYKQTMEAIRKENNERLGQGGPNHGGGTKSQTVQPSSDAERQQGNSCVRGSSASTSTGPKATVWKMSAERIVRLQAINFEWDVQASEYDTSWNHRYVDLLKYKAVHGNCRVPKTHENKELSQWVKQMRRYYALKMDDGSGAPPSTFTDDRIRQLEEIGFEWRLK